MRGRAEGAIVALTRGATIVALSGATIAGASAQQTAPASRVRARDLVFDRVTVVDVERGALLREQRVVVRGNRIRIVGDWHGVPLPRGAEVVDARGQYMIPGLWDMHVHPWDWTSVAYPLFIATGVTGIRDAGSTVPLATLQQWRREILAGHRVGPPRQLLAGPSIGGCPTCTPGEHASNLYHHILATSPDDGRFLVDSLATAGADFIKSYDPPAPIYFAMAAEARRRRISFEGHLTHSLEGNLLAQLRVSADSGQRAFDHVSGRRWCGTEADSASLETCRQLAALLRRHDAWLVPTPTLDYVGRHQAERHMARRRYMPDSIWNVPHRQQIDSFFLPRLLGRAIPDYDTMPPPNAWDLAERAGLPVLLGTDAIFTGVFGPPDPVGVLGFRLHDALELLVDGGMSPLGALRAATLAPAEYLHATDSMGTVAPGKLADFVVLAGDPLANIGNTTTIQAVVANGRFFDRAALDHLLAEAERAALTAPPFRKPPSPRKAP